MSWLMRLPGRTRLTTLLRRRARQFPFESPLLALTNWNHAVATWNGDA